MKRVLLVAILLTGCGDPRTYSSPAQWAHAEKLCEPHKGVRYMGVVSHGDIWPRVVCVDGAIVEMKMPVQ